MKHLRSSGFGHSTPGVLAPVRVIVSRSIITYSAPSALLADTPQFPRRAGYMRRLRCAGWCRPMAAEIAGQHRVTLGADKGYDRKELVRELRAHQVTPHFARKVYSAIDCRTTRHPGYAISQVKRKRVEEIFGWLKTVAGLRKTRHRGIARVGWTFTFAAAAYNLVRMRNLLLVAT